MECNREDVLRRCGLFGSFFIPSLPGTVRFVLDRDFHEKDAIVLRTEFAYDTITWICFQVFLCVFL